MRVKYTPVAMDDGRIGVEFTGMASAPPGTDPREVITALRYVLSAGLEGSAVELEDIGLWPDGDSAREGA